MRGWHVPIRCLEDIGVMLTGVIRRNIIHLLGNLPAGEHGRYILPLGLLPMGNTCSPPTVDTGVSSRLVTLNHLDDVASGSALDGLD